MHYTKPKNYAGRWLVRILQGALVFGIVFFTLDAIAQFMYPSQNNAMIVVHPVGDSGSVILQRQNTIDSQTQLDEYDYFRLALDHQMSGEYYDAIVDYTRVLGLNPDLSSAYLNRGVAYEQLGSCSGHAITDFHAYMTRESLAIIEQPSVAESATFTLTMAQDHRYDIPIKLNAGDVLNLSVESVNDDEVDPIIVLVDGYGRPVAANDDARRQDGSLISMNAYINNYQVTRDGVYTLMISHAGGGSYGDFYTRMTIDK